MMLAQIPELTSDDKLRISGVYETWTPGAYEVGDVRNYSGQTWECFQAHDNATYSDITPDNAACSRFGDRYTARQLQRLGLLCLYRELMTCIEPETL